MGNRLRPDDSSLNEPAMNFAWATLPDAEKLGRFLRESVGVIPGVRRTETFVTLAIRKRDYGVPIA